jgi:hypothetical protein
MKKIIFSFEEFDGKFFHESSPLIRVGINREMLHHNVINGDAAIFLKRNIKPNKFIAKFSLYAPWHVSNETNEPSGGPSLDTRPILLNKIISEESHIREHHISHIANIRNWFSSNEPTAPAIAIDVVTLALGKKCLIVLDGNHRISALIHELENGNSVNVRINEYRVKSKDLSTQLLPDLRYLIK